MKRYASNWLHKLFKMLVKLTGNACFETVTGRVPCSE